MATAPNNSGCPFKVKGAIFISLIGHFQFSFIRLPKQFNCFSINFPPKQQQIFVFRSKSFVGRKRPPGGHFSFIRNSERTAGAPRADPSSKNQGGSLGYFSLIFFWQGQDHLEAGQLVFQLLLVPSASPCAKRKNGNFSLKKISLKVFKKLPVVQ
jgi:hypothetical protein